ncbi:TetR/AcrR family transcriptional regulator [Streptoalloteichus hindustanus]|uniref:Transcriptional regulator, TetR family n=1 Tax=Streptoalloteichus hindustanus TaxID=2017 RepID=A0A1M5D725_STRHI|nr:TetR/AcrR family transcriptional regulator C-terminal domain-containing protein [Streptoalloteichus hindustanus]SHF62482.1 transcriptional regulator, TetR family [Streptoalloteichus hindustanus]
MTPRERPRRGPVRREQIAAAALAVLLDRGYAGTSIRAIAEHAGCSLETLYRHFENKEALFLELVNSFRKRIVEPLRDVAAAPSTDRELKEALTRAGTLLFDVLTSDEGLKMQRLTFAESGRFPELGRLVYDEGIKPFDNAVAAILSDAAARGLLRCPDPLEAARVFSGMVLFDPRERLLLGIEQPPSFGDRSDYIERVVTLFLAGVRGSVGTRR